MNAPQQTAFALIGCGPRGMNVLERFVLHAHRDPQRRPIVLHVIDPGAPGPGIHATSPDHHLLNTIATQLTTFVDEQMVTGGGVRGPSLYEWAARRGVRVTSNTGEVRAVQPADHLPRRLLGEYLTWAFDQLLEVCPPWLAIRVHAGATTAVHHLPDGRERVATADGATVDVDAVLLCVGHAGTPAPPAPDLDVPRSAWTGNPYRADELARIGAAGAVGLLGGGLTAMDVIAELTVGRGGRYEQVEDGLRYLPGGNEPKIVLVTRTGLPSRARPRPYRSGQIAPRHLTGEALEEIRAGKTDGRLDFRHDVLPLVRAEMRHRIESMVPDPLDAHRVVDRVLAAWDGDVPIEALHCAGSYHEWFVRQVEQDLVQAHLGLDGSPLKAAFEVHRDLREVLRRAVDGRGMDQGSRAHFFGAFAAAVNRNVIGPQLERNEELVALVRAGVLSPGFGPSSALTWSDDRWLLESTTLAEPGVAVLDHVVCGYSPAPSISASANPVLRQLLAAGRVRPVLCGATELGAEVDGDGHAVDVRGTAQPTLAVLGPLAEGSSYYNHYVTSPGGRSRATVDADRVVRAALTAFDTNLVATR
ncbi:FAD/NAD(P)-binding protein [Amycolatopsis sp. CA-126428]|uniref:FAD/NAD(P)-binding protein n=1 Tax=Amycolatopsis sp. CA-126428 TaxID=2073158 RepID=UPI000CD115C6|nr:FAD/NAD(P)-binding domain-containing protein [Amycolatopsis sp. CA-126428]